MKTFAHLLQRRAFAWAIVVVTALFAVLTLALSTTVVQDDDLLAFLPEGNEDIVAFQVINERFGGLDVALVGLQVDNPFDTDFLTRLNEATEALNTHSHIDYALSLTNVEDYSPDPMGGIQQGRLITDIPQSTEAQAALRAKVMSKDHLIGNVISAEARGVMIYVFPTYGTDARVLADTVTTIVTHSFPSEETGVTTYWGGAPFISSYIFTACQQDLLWLSPLSIVVIIGIILFSFRDWIGCVLALISTLIGVFSAQAAMAVLDIAYNIVLSGMPVILFAVGSAYSIHMLSRYYANVANTSPSKALEITLVQTGPIVIAAGLTTVAGLGSFVVMDIAPMRTFGLFTAFGILVTLVLSIVFVPAVISLVNPTGRANPGGPLNRLVLSIAERAQTHRLTAMLGLAILALLGGFLVGRVDSRVDQGAFFSPGSPPDLAQTFLDDRFGGSQFLQVHFTGDVSDAHVLREIRQLADQLLLLPDVTDVIHIGEVIALTNDAMYGSQRIPDTTAQSQLLLRFLTGNRSVGQLITEDQTEALLHVKIGSNGIDALERVLEAAENLVPNTDGLVLVPTGPKEAGRAPLLSMVADRIDAALVTYFAEPAPLQREALLARVAQRPTVVPAGPFTQQLTTWLTSEECWVAPSPEQAQQAAEAWASLGPNPSSEAVVQTLSARLTETVSAEALDDLVADLIVTAEGEVDTLWRRARAKTHSEALLTDLKILPPSGPKGARFKAAVSHALLDLNLPLVAVPSPNADALTLSVRVTGLPQLYRGLSRSISSNQLKSLGVALLLVLLIMTVLFRSLTAGLIATSPTLFTLLVVYGAMGLMEVHLDIGTSMLASLIVGAGVDYSVHLMAAWRGSSPEQSLRHAITETSVAIWTNALMVAAGFFVLSLGEARPLQNVGLLTAAAMLAAAVGCFLVIPVFARKTHYMRPTL